MPILFVLIYFQIIVVTTFRFIVVILKFDIFVHNDAYAIDTMNNVCEACMWNILVFIDFLNTSVISNLLAVFVGFF